MSHYPKGKTKRLEANIPVEKSIRVRKDAEAPTVEDYTEEIRESLRRENDYFAAIYFPAPLSYGGDEYTSNAEREADRAAGRDS